MGITAKQEKFVREYVLTGNASESYRRAYPKSQMWKENAVTVAGSKLLSNTKVSVRLAELQEEVKNEFDISAERLLLEQSRIALFDFRRLFDKEGRLIAPVDMPEDVAAAVSSVKVLSVKRIGDKDSEELLEQSIIELKLWNKNNSIDSLFKHKGLYEKDNSQRKSSIGEMTREELIAIARGE